MFKKLWVKLFLKIAVIFTVFVVVLAVANSAFLLNYYIKKEKNQMVSVAEKIDEINLYEETAATQLSAVISDSSYRLKIEDSFGNTLFSSFDSPVADYKGFFERDKFLPSPDYAEKEGFSIVNDKGGEDVLSYICFLSGGETLQLTTVLSILKNSATIANEFMVNVAVVCLFLSLLWVLFLARGIARPIRRMQETTSKMAALDFSEKLEVSAEDEIGQLADSINILSNSLDVTLEDLQNKNKQLRNEIEAERRLEKMRKGFVANVSHELKTPISIISGYAEGLKIGVGGETQREQYTDVIINEAGRMNDMVLSLLELSRMEAGQMPLDLQVYDLSAQLNEAAKRFRLKNEEAKIETEMPEQLYVYSDIEAVEKILNNYLSNALSHLKKDGKILISAKKENNKIKIAVYNDGDPIPTEEMERIWESFYRGDSSHKRESDRVGLGLSIVKAAVTLLGTQCGVVNKEDGVEFWFTLNENCEDQKISL